MGDVKFMKMSCHMLHWFRVPLTIQLKRDKAGHGEVTINNAATFYMCFVFAFNLDKTYNVFPRCFTFSDQDVRG